MVKIQLVYEGDLHCKLRHGPSGTIITTDAPVDNQGKGESFSPTDLLASSLGSCMMTVMAIAARKDKIELKGTTLDIVKEMATQPVRRIARVSITFHMASGIAPAHRKMLEAAAHNCPVSKSLNPDTEVVIEFQYP